MNSSRLQDTSLYELALSSEQPPHPLQVSPTIFKSMVATVIDLLIEQKIPATLWLKLPRGDIWQAEIDRYRKLAGAPHSIYILNSYREDKENISEKAGSNSGEDAPEESRQAELAAAEAAQGIIPGETSLIGDQGIVSVPIAYSTTLALPLAAESRLRREYFLLVLSANFCSLVLSHRPRSVQQLKPDLLDVKQPQSTGVKLGLTEEDLERKHPLLGLCSFDMHTIQQVLAGINRAICFGQSQTEPSAEAKELLVNWDSIIEQSATPDPVLLGHLFTRQIQRQEEIWHSSAAYRKQAEAASALQLQNEELLNSVRLKDEFLKNVGQELRTPLTTMKTALTLLNSPNLKPAQRQRYMEMLSHECDRQSSLITSVLDLVQLEVVEQTPMQPIRLIDVVPGVVSTYQPLAQEKGIMLAYTVAEDLPAVSCLSAWVRQIVINLLHNAIKFTPAGGQVWVRAKQQGEYIQIEFRDTGSGIPTMEIPKIFDRFYRVRQNIGQESSGAGLGLSIVQQLLLRCGGSISVKSKPEEGSAFNVLLPIYR